jgi:hypothetical protein
MSHCRGIAQARQALLVFLDAVDPLQVIETTRHNTAPEEAQRPYSDDSLQGRKDRGSVDAPLFGQDRPEHRD